MSVGNTFVVASGFFMNPEVKASSLDFSPDGDNVCFAYKVLLHSPDWLGPRILLLLVPRAGVTGVHHCAWLK